MLPTSGESLLHSSATRILSMHMTDDEFQYATDSISNHAMRFAWGFYNILALNYVILHSKWRNTCFTVWLKIFFFRNGELLKIILKFHKNCQNIFQNYTVFLPNTHIQLVFLSCDEEFLALLNDPRKISKCSKLRKWRRFFWKFCKWIFSKRPPLNFFIFFWWIFDNMD